MKILANKEIKNLFLSLSLVFGVTFLLAEVFLWLSYRRLSMLLLILFLLAGGAVWAVCFVYFNRQNQIMEQAILQINAYLDGDRNARIECDNEGELYRLFHSINSLAAVLNAHADNELREKEFLKNTISDISHQLKTPLAALNIYNGLLQDEDIEVSSVKEFAGLSEQELDRIETLVQSLLKITRLDAGAIVLEKNAENVADMMRDIELHFAYRARQEKKEIILSGSDHLSLFCDRDWLNEAIAFHSRHLPKSVKVPSDTCNTRSAVCAILRLWVIIMMVCSYFFDVSLSNAMTSLLFCESKFPVGSSARIREGRVINARPIATLCC